MNKSFLKLSVIAVSIFLAACAGGGGGNGGGGNGGNNGNGGGGGGISTGGTPTGGGGNGGGGNVAIPMPTIDPSATDSTENAPSVIETSNKFDNNDYGQSNRQADHLNLKDAYDEGLDGTGVSVGVIDGALSKVNPALTNVIDHGKFGANSTSINHATAVSLAIAGSDVNGNVLGIAKNVQLHFADASASDTTISRDASLRAMYDLRNSGIRIINNSYGSSLLSDYIKDANDYLNAIDQNAKDRSYIGQLKKLVDNNTLLIWAAGNEGSNQPTNESLLPLAEPELEKGFITVVGINDDNTLNNKSNKCGDAKNWCIAALWKFNTVNVNATNLDEMKDYALSTTAGTSIAAPQVTAAVALVAQKYPWMSNENLKTTILTTATDLGAKGVDSVYGWGLLNIGKAILGPAQFAFGNFNANVTDGEYIFSNDISGEGGLNKYGNGSLNLSGKNTFQGETNINSGTLILSGSTTSKTTVQENGKYKIVNAGQSGSVINKGVFYSEDAVIDGDFTQSQNGKFETLIGSVTTVKETANLDGNLSFIGIKNGYIPMDNTTVDVITAKKINGQFTSTDIDSKLLLEGTTKYSENNVQLDINRISAKKAIQNLSLNDTDQNVIELGASALDQAFEKLDSYILTNDVNTNTLTFAEGASKLQNISTNKNLVNSLYSLTGSIYSNSASISSLVQDRLSQDFLSYFDGANEKATAIVQFNHINNKWNPHGLSSKQNTNSGLLGAVKKVNANLTVGAAYNFQKTDLSQGISAHKTDNADIKTNGILIGAKYKPEILKGVAIKSSLGYSDYRNNVNRIIFLDDDDYSTDRKVKGDFWQLTLLSEKQFNFNNFILLPQIGIQYDYLQQDSFVEDGALGFGLSADKLNKGILSGKLKLIGQYNFNIKNIPFNLFGVLALDHDFNSRKFATRGGFKNMHINHVKAGYWDLPKNRWSIGTGFNVLLSKKINAGLNYYHEQSSANWRNNRVNANIKIDF